MRYTENDGLIGIFVSGSTSTGIADENRTIQKLGGKTPSSLSPHFKTEPNT
jgi:hypothetical protein